MTDAAASVNGYQKGWGHPLTCGSCQPPERDELPLVAHMDGDLVVLTCPMCDYRQVMTDDLLRNVVAMSKATRESFASDDDLPDATQMDETDDWLFLWMMTATVFALLILVYVLSRVLS